MSVHFKKTKYGFEFGSAVITRLFSNDKNGATVFGVKTPRKVYGEGLQIYTTRTGMIKVSDSRGEWTPPKGTS